MIDKHIRLDKGQNERIAKTGKTVVEVIEFGLKSIEEQVDDLPSWLFNLQDADSKQIYSYLKKLDDSDFSKGLVNEVYERGLQTKNRDLLVKITDSNSIYYLPLVEKYVGPLASEENRLNVVRSEIESLESRRDELIDEIEDLKAERENETEVSREIQKLQAESENIGARINDYTEKRNKLSEEVLELKKKKDSLMAPIVKQIVTNWINEEYTLGTVLIGDAIWNYHNPYRDQTDQERAETFEELVHFFRGMRSLCHVTVDNMIKVAEEVKEAHPEFNE